MQDHLTALGKGFANFVTKYGLTVIAHSIYGKSIELMAENSAGASVPIIRRIVEGVRWSWKGRHRQRWKTKSSY